MEQLTFSQHVAANGGSLPWQDAVRLTLLTIQTISAQADPETTYMDVCPEQIVLSKDAREVLSCGKPHSLKGTPPMPPTRSCCPGSFGTPGVPAPRLLRSTRSRPACSAL